MVHAEFEYGGRRAAFSHLKNIRMIAQKSNYHYLPPMIRIALVALSSIGLLISLYFTLIYYRVITSDPRFLPRFCTLSEGACRTIMDAPQARLFGLPNSLIGLFYYSLLLF